jgi:hypothetical protein
MKTHIQYKRKDKMCMLRIYKFSPYMLYNLCSKEMEGNWRETGGIALHLLWIITYSQKYEMQAWIVDFQSKPGMKRIFLLAA